MRQASGRPVRLLFVSNGHGEDSVGQVLAAEVLARAKERVEIAAFPIVGQGVPYRQAGIPVIGPRRELPSGGFAYLSTRALLRDVLSGGLALALCQLAFARRVRDRYDGVVGIGDRVSLLLDLHVLKKPMAWVGVANSVRYVPPGREMGTRTMRRALRECCLAVFARDPETSESLRRLAIQADYVGNPMMDAVAFREERAEVLDQILRAHAWDGKASLVVLLPGSRSDAFLNLTHQLDAVRRLHQLLLGGVFAAVAWPANLDAAKLSDELTSSGWTVEPAPPVAGHAETGMFRVVATVKSRGHAPQPGHGNAGVPLIVGAFPELVRRAMLVIGLAGTAVEQAAGLGKPVVTFRSRGSQVTDRFLENQKKLLDGAVAVVPPNPGAVASEAAVILSSPERYRQMSEIGRERMGPPGATAVIAERIIKVFGAEEVKQAGPAQALGLPPPST